MLGAEKEIIANYVASGQVRVVFWPMLDHGLASLNAHAAADCVGRQNPSAFWIVHDRFFEDQRELWGADRAYFVEAALSVGLDQATFEACFDNGDGHAAVTELDSIRRDRNIYNRPSFDINGQFVIGAQPFGVFVEYFEALLP